MGSSQSGKGIFGPVRQKVTGDWRNLHNEDLQNLYLPNIFRVVISRRTRQIGMSLALWEMINGYTLVAKLEKRPFGRP
jgi:hypothetical protein